MVVRQDHLFILPFFFNGESRMNLINAPQLCFFCRCGVNYLCFGCISRTQNGKGLATFRVRKVLSTLLSFLPSQLGSLLLQGHSTKAVQQVWFSVEWVECKRTTRYTSKKGKKKSFSFGLATRSLQRGDTKDFETKTKQEEQACFTWLWRR